MRIFKDCMEMIKEVERDLFEMGIKYQSKTVQDKDVSLDEDFQTLELPGYAYKISNLEDKKISEMLEYMKMPEDWVEAEFQERIHPELQNPGKAYELYDVWKEYIHDGQFSYTYNERIRQQLPYILKELIKRSNTRQTVITVYDKNQDMRSWGGKARIPCSMHYQIMLRNKKLYMIYVMRSCDFLKHFPADVALAIKLQKYILYYLNLETNSQINLGSFTHFIGSLHAFNGDLKKRGIF